jgi:hypothetical protein
MSALTQQDFGQLQAYAVAGDRYGYWKYLSDRGDAYATMALGVVTNEARSGYIANQFMNVIIGVRVDFSAIAA